MRQSELEQFGEMLEAVAETYGKKLTPALLKIYFEALKRYEFGDVARAFSSHVQNPDCGQFMPKPADVIRFIDGGGQARSLQAWTKVETAIKHCGAYSSIVFDDAIIHAVIADMGGWINLCRTSLDEMPFRAAEFQKRYAGYQHRPLVNYPAKLLGVFENENSQNGFKSQQPALIGDETKAKVVLEGGSNNVTPIAIKHDARPVMQLISHGKGANQ